MNEWMYESINDECIQIAKYRIGTSSHSHCSRQINEWGSNETAPCSHDVHGPSSWSDKLINEWVN